MKEKKLVTDLVVPGLADLAVCLVDRGQLGQRQERSIADLVAQQLAGTGSRLELVRSCQHSSVVASEHTDDMWAGEDETLKIPARLRSPS